MPFFGFTERLHCRRTAALGFCVWAFAAVCAAVRCSVMPFFYFFILFLFFFVVVKTAFFYFFVVVKTAFFIFL
jgi:hypothetical protein